MLASRTSVLQKICLLILLASTSVGGCKYAKFTPSHTMCLPDKSSCKVLEKGVSKDDITKILQVHNTIRADVAAGKSRNQPQASDMKQVEWDNELATVAQRWAEQCKPTPDCVQCREVDRFPVGQNIRRHRRTASKERGPDLAQDWEATINNWYQAVKEFKSPSSLITNYVHNTKYETYSQVVWANTSLVGCGFAGFQDGGWDVKMYVCNYGAGGNVIEYEMYKIGNPCTECPDGWSKCSTKFPGLCEKS